MVLIPLRRRGYERVRRDVQVKVRGLNLGSSASAEAGLILIRVTADTRRSATSIAASVFSLTVTCTMPAAGSG
jgi:hypothetical protein